MGEIDLGQVLCPQIVDVQDRKFKDKDALFWHMAKMFEDAGYITDSEGFVQALYERERLGSTYMEGNLVLPHGKAKCVVKPGVGICRFQPMQYDKDSEEVAQIAVMLSIPEVTQSNEYLRLLASVSSSLLDENVTDMLMKEKEAEVIVDKMKEKISC